MRTEIYPSWLQHDSESDRLCWGNYVATVRRMVCIQKTRGTCANPSYLQWPSSSSFLAVHRTGEAKFDPTKNFHKRPPHKCPQTFTCSVFSLLNPTKVATEVPRKVSTEVPRKVSTQVVGINLLCYHLLCSLAISNSASCI